MILYALYGYKHSKERRVLLDGLITTNSMIKDSSTTGILNSISDYQSIGTML